jgi:Flp pilus assembly protein TadD
MTGSPSPDLINRLDQARARQRTGDLQGAAALLRAIVHDHPRTGAAYHQLGLIAHGLGDLRQATQLIEQAVALAPEDGVAWNSLGQLHAVARNWEVAGRCFEQAVKRRGADPDALNNLANIRKRQGRTDEALDLYRQVLDLRPDVAHALYNLARLLHDRRAFAEAIALFRRAVAVDPANYRARYQLGVSLEESGDFEEAAEQYRAALTLRPDHARALGNLLVLRNGDAGPELADRAERLAGSAQFDNEERSRLLSGLGKYYDRNDETDRAFHFFEASNAVQRTAQSPPTREQVRAVAETIMARYGREHFDAVRELGDLSTRPIFIVGLPRSGTTLVEQILASHPAVFGGGELMLIPRLAAEAGPWRDAATIRNGAERYLAQLDTFAATGASHVTDKLPVNYRHLGLIASLFPKATIIHCRRDPRDVALSCFVEMIALAEDDFASLDGIAEAIVTEARLMAHWQALLPRPVLTMDYARLIDDQAGETRRLLDGCGLPFDPACLRFFETDRTVDTPSRWQVRQPIYTSSRGRWERYAEHLAPLIDRLESEGLLSPGQ